MQNNLASFTPVTVTVETLQILAKQNNYTNLLALYMAYVEVSTWQKDNSVKASMSFMMKRLHWGERKLSESKKELIGLGLIENVKRTDNKGKVTGHYVLIKHVVNPPPGFHQGVDSEGTSANDLQLNANNYKTADESEITKKEESYSFGGVARRPTASPPLALGSRAADAPTVGSLYYQVIKKYQLAVTNHGNVKKWIKDLEDSLGNDIAILYLTRLMQRDLNKERTEEEFVPTLSTPFDITQKSTKIIQYFKRTKDRAVNTSSSDDYLERNNEEARRLRESAKVENNG